MKKLIQTTALALSLTFVASAVAPKRAEAIIGLATGNVPAIVVGSILSAAGIGAALGIGLRNSGVSAAAFGVIGAAAGAVLGLLILDESNGGLPQFQPLTLEQQGRLAVNADEYAVYESELEEIGAAISTGAAQAVAANVQTVEHAKGFFDAEYSNLSPETRSVMSKIAQANFQTQN